MLPMSEPLDHASDCIVMTLGLQLSELKKQGIVSIRHNPK